ncbi:MFS transporter [Leucobacter sp. cx-328]|uniref:MFS transporter n=1 Tax=unclassified Leucobacter TaxID=2621730 RepID=UPI00165DCC23|nr:MULTISPECIES: MFS transporter [unclassified Leucobacter]MBC9944134.1 MFS transporter [Leucobacter sp. cx-328]
MPKPAKHKLPFEVWALVAGGFTVALGYGVVAPVIPQFALEFGVSTFAASAIVSAFALMRLVGAPLAGWIVVKLGERRTYTLGILIVAASTGAAALAQTYAQFMVLRGIGGLGSAMFTIAATALLVEVSPPDARGRVASVNAASFLLGGLLGPVLGGVVAGYGVRAPFVFYFITLVIAAIIVTIALRSKRATGGTAQAKSADQPMQLREALGIRHYRALLVSVFAFGWTSFGVRISIIPLFVAIVFNGDAALAAWVLAGYAAGNAILILPSGRWNDTIGRKPLLIIGLSVVSVSYLVFPLAHSVWQAAVIMVVAGLGSALANPGQQAVLADVLGNRRGGTVVSTYSMSSDLGGLLGPLVAGAIVDAAGFGLAFAVTAALTAIAAVYWATMPDSRTLRTR